MLKVVIPFEREPVLGENCGSVHARRIDGATGRRRRLLVGGGCGLYVRARGPAVRGTTLGYSRGDGRCGDVSVQNETSARAHDARRATARQYRTALRMRARPRSRRSMHIRRLPARLLRSPRLRCRCEIRPSIRRGPYSSSTNIWTARVACICRIGRSASSVGVGRTHRGAGRSRRHGGVRCSVAGIHDAVGGSVARDAIHSTHRKRPRASALVA